MGDLRHVRHDNKWQSYILTENLRTWTKGQEIYNNNKHRDREEERKGEGERGGLVF